MSPSEHPSHLRAIAFATAANALLAGVLAFAPAAQALSSTPTQTYVTNALVRAVVPTANAIYIGGSFDQVGPRTGPGVGIARSTGQSIGLPEVAGGSQEVDAVVRDGSGGFYIGGSFTHVGTFVRRNLAHILSDGSVDPNFHPSANGNIRALALSGSVLYAGGNFTSIGGKVRSRIAALNTTNGGVTNWNPNAANATQGFGVRALAVSGSTVYVGGDFTQIGGKVRNQIAALNASTGAATNWNPNANSGTGGYTLVDALVVSGSTVYAGGHFSAIGGQARKNIAALNTTSGAATGWHPQAAGGNELVTALVVSNSTVYAGGNFTVIGGQTRHGLAALNTTSGAATSWNPNANTYWVDALAVSGSTVYAGGHFTQIGGQSRNYLAALNATTGAATSWNPNANSVVTALAVSGSTVYAGGILTSIGGQTRHGLAALDPTTGAVTSWNPNPSGGSGPTNKPQVGALAVSGSTVYAGGIFNSIGGQVRHNIAALDATTGTATSWNPNATGGQAYLGPSVVGALAVSGSTVYAGGGFTSIGGQTRNHIAALDATTGAATSWDPNPNLYTVDALGVSGSTVYAGGQFTQIGGQARYFLAALDATTGAATGGPGTGWNDYWGSGDFGGPVNALALSGSTLYIGGRFGSPRNLVAALDATTGFPTSWDPNASGGYGGFDPGGYSVAASGSTVFAGGDFTQIGGKARNYLAALDATTAAATSWNPNPNNSNNNCGCVLALAVGPDGSLWAGGVFNGFDRAPQQGIAKFAP